MLQIKGRLRVSQVQNKSELSDCKCDIGCIRDICRHQQEPIPNDSGPIFILLQDGPSVLASEGEDEPFKD